MNYNLQGYNNTSFQHFVLLTDEEKQLQKLNDKSSDDTPLWIEKLYCRIYYSWENLSKWNNFNLDITIKDLNLYPIDEITFFAIVRCKEIKNIDPSNPDDIYQQIKGSKSKSAFVYWNDEGNETWEIWKYLGAHQNGNWPPPDNYRPFIIPNDYKTFVENDDNLDKCIAAFKNDIPKFLRKRWNSSILTEFAEDLQKIENNDNTLEAFNEMIAYPSDDAAIILNGLFTDLPEEHANMLSDDTYTIIGYFYT